MDQIDGLILKGFTAVMCYSGYFLTVHAYTFQEVPACCSLCWFSGGDVSSARTLTSHPIAAPPCRGRLLTELLLLFAAAAANGADTDAGAVGADTCCCVVVPRPPAHSVQ